MRREKKGVKGNWRWWYEHVLDLFFPRYCIFCGETASGRHWGLLCDRCRVRIKRIRGIICFKCGINLPDRPPGEGEVICAFCRERRPGFDKARAFADYHEGEVIKNLILQLKYSDRIDFAPVLGEFLTEAHKHFYPEKQDLIMAVPLHAKRERERGYNQSELLAEIVSRQAEIPLLKGGLKRWRATSVQSGNYEKRRANVKGCFEVNKPDAIKGKNILLIDDVFTTGATVGECASSLKQSGADRVEVLTLARAGF